MNTTTVISQSGPCLTLVTRRRIGPEMPASIKIELENGVESKPSNRFRSAEARAKTGPEQIYFFQKVNVSPP